MTAERLPVEAGHVMVFARAIGDDNPVYRDPDARATVAAGGLLAPPTFVQASAQFDPDYPLRPRPGVTWFGSGALRAASSRREDAAAAPAAGQVVAVAGARACTPSSTTSTTGPCVPARC